MLVTGFEGVVRGLEGTHPADTCILTKLKSNAIYYYQVRCRLV
jgi:hypothetical protein